MYSYDEAFQTSLEYFNGNELAAKICVDKYLLRDADNNLLEKSPDDMHWRLAKEFARIEKNKFKSPLTEEQIYSYLKNFEKIIPQGSPLSGIGNHHQIVSLSNCFVVPPPYDSYGGILLNDQYIVQISKRRGGIGYDISTLRPKDLPVKNSARTTTGAVSFMHRFSNSGREVGQANRRGAQMITISVHHPDILDFIKIKNDEISVTGANISVRLSDEFLDAVKKNKNYELRWPVDSKNPQISKKVKAKEIWDEIINSAWLRAEPGLLFWDNILTGPADCYEEFRSSATNPCCIAQSVDTYIVTSNGIKEIKTITQDDLIWLDHEQKFVKNSGYFTVGKQPVFKVTFSNNESVTITKNHKLAKSKVKRVGSTLEYDGFELVELQYLKVGDSVSIHKNIVDTNFGKDGSYNEGLILGWLTGDGCLCYHDDRQDYPDTILTFWQDEQDVGHILQKVFTEEGYDLELTDNKVNNCTRLRSSKFTSNFTNKYEYNIWKFKSENQINQFLFNASREFIIGYLKAYFTADGSVTNTSAKTYQITLASINKNRLYQIKNLLLYFGIKSSVGLMKKAGESEFKNGGKYQTKDCWRLVITGQQSIERFHQNIGFLSSRKQQRLTDLVNIDRTRKSKNQHYVTIKSIEQCGEDIVGCIEVEDYHYFTANGIISGNSEIPLSNFDSCRLMAINLFTYVRNPFTEKTYFDYRAFYEDSQIAQRLMDDLVDLEVEAIDRIIAKILADPEPFEIKESEINLWNKVKSACLNGRRTGLGILGLGDTIAALNIKYGSKESIETVDKIYMTLKFGSYISSVNMAKELGPFPAWNWELEEGNDFLMRFKDEVLDLGNEHYIYGDMILKSIIAHGRRNVANLTTAPTGTISMLAKIGPYHNISSGIEPVFMLEFIRRKKINHDDKKAKVDFVDAIGDKWTNFVVYHSGFQLWKDITGKSEIKDSPYYQATAEEIDWLQRVRLQAAAQKHICHAISSTINLPEDVSKEEVAKIYEESWKAGLKGITVYRKNCRSGVLVENKEEKANIDKRPKELPCEVNHVTVKGNHYFVLVGMMENRPYEVFAGKNGFLSKDAKHGVIVKRGKAYKAIFDDEDKTELCPITSMCNEQEEAITRLSSALLRTGAPISIIVEQLEKVSGDITNFAKALARILKKYIPDGTKIEGEKCPDCSGTDIIRSEGCRKCKQCGWSACL